MNQHHKRAIAQASIPLGLGAVGLLQLGYVNWPVLLVMLAGTVWVYRSAYVRSRNAEKYGMPPKRY